MFTFISEIWKLFWSFHYTHHLTFLICHQIVATFSYIKQFNSYFSLIYLFFSDILLSLFLHLLLLSYSYFVNSSKRYTLCKAKGRIEIRIPWINCHFQIVKFPPVEEFLLEWLSKPWFNVNTFCSSSTVGYLWSINTPPVVMISFLSNLSDIYLMYNPYCLSIYIFIREVT